MIRIIVSAILLVLVAVFVSLNIGYTASVNLLGARIFNGVSIVAVSALSFAFGIMYSLFIFIGGSVRRKAKRELAAKGQNMKAREKQLDSREAESLRAAKAAAAADLHGQDATISN